MSSKWAEKQKEIFHIERYLMSFVNMWPGDNLINPKFLIIYLLNFALLIPMFFYCARTDDEFYEIAFAICEVIQFLVYNVKLISIITDRSEMKSLIKSLQKGFKDLAKSSIELRAFHDKIVYRSFIVIAVMLVSFTTALFVYFYVPILIDLVKYLLGRDDLSYPLVLKGDYVFFDPRESGIVFVIYTIISRIYINYFLMEFYFMDLFLVTLFFYIASYMEGVKLSIQLLAKDSDVRVMAEAEVIERFKRIIDNHVRAIWMVKTLDKILRMMLLTQFALFSLTFCLVMFNFTLLVNHYFLLVIVSVFLVVAQSEQFVFCFLATKIQTESDLIGRYAYELQFYNRSTKFQKMVAFVIMRSQDKKIAVTAGQFYISDLESFGRSLQTSIGYFALVKSVYTSV